jgi:prepilin-type N-terminal cleavage/methylation domain-containing protein
MTTKPPTTTIHATTRTPTTTHKAFTLVEVLIATAIISVVGVALLSMNSNSTYLFTKSLQKKHQTNTLNISALNTPLETTDQKTSLYDTISDSYSIDDDKIATFFIEIEYEYRLDEFSAITFAEEEDEEEAQNSQEDDKIVNPYTIEILKTETFSELGGAYLYRFEFTN